MANLYNKINELCVLRGITTYRLCKDTGISQSTIGDLKSGRKTGINAVTAVKIADYFGISVNSLLGENESEKNTLTIKDSERELLNLYRAANPHLQQLILGALRSNAPTQPAPGVVESDE